MDVSLDLFALGVASGDPTHESVVLWTRLIGDDLPDRAPLVWELAYDSGFVELAATGVIEVVPDLAHSAHVEAVGLPSATTFHYRFRTGTAISAVGQTRTMPADGTDVAKVRIGVSSCQLIETGHWAAHEDIAAADLDLMVWLGDFIYGGGGFSNYEGRSHIGGDPTTLADYRARYAQYRQDPVLQRASAAHPWLVTWDDHEVDNDYDAGVDPVRRAAAYQAWWEHQPTRLPAPGSEGGSASDGFAVYRSVDLGDLCRVTVLDARQYADDSTLLGDEQRTWLAGQLDNGASWALLGSPVLVGGLLVPGQETLLPYTWDGYPLERAWLAEQLAARPNRICLSGDLHSSAALTVSADPADRSLPVVATEFMAPAISSEFPPDVAPFVPFIPLANAHIEHIDTKNGWLMLDIEPHRVTATFRHVIDVGDPNSAIASFPRYEVLAGDPVPHPL
ncbi:MAG: alkaline phosphatase D [Acidimicrobiales bacterium]|jgi:alkaline phosphatase D